jgi:hypothetical protein
MIASFHLGILEVCASAKSVRREESKEIEAYSTAFALKMQLYEFLSAMSATMLP